MFHKALRHLGLEYTCALAVFCCLPGLFCTDNYRFVDEDIRESGERLYIKNFSRALYGEEAQILWSLKAKEAFLFQKGIQTDSEHVIAYGFTFIQYDTKETLRFRLQAKRGELDQRKEKLFLEGEAMYEDRKKNKISSEKMEYDLAKKTLSSAAAVRLQQPGTDTLCRQGVQMDFLNGKQLCRKPEIKNQSVQGRGKENWGTFLN